MAYNNINIPMELVIIILIRLPIKSIFRFKCVCKSWYILIQSQEFFKLHLNQSLKTNSYNCSLILPITRNLVVNCSPSAVSSLYRAYLNPSQAQLDITKLALPLSFRPSLEKISRVDNFFLSKRDGRNVVYGKIEVVGSCNGLVFILSGMHHFAVCNPAIEHEHAFKILPCITYPQHCYYYHPPCYNIYYSARKKSRSFLYRVFGFGYDSVTCTFKIVHLSIERVLVYSLARDGRSWRTIELPHRIIKYNLMSSRGHLDQEKRVLMDVYGHGVATNNHLHWNITEYDPEIFEYSREAILSFDVSNEEWGEVSVPDEVVKEYYSLSGFVIKPYIIELGVLDGCLCLLSSRGISYPNLDLWIMKEYGVKESWTRLCKLPSGSGIPLFYHKDRYEFLLPGTQHGLGWFNPRDNKIRKVEFHGCEFTGENYYSTRVRMCIESFIDPFSSMNTVLPISSKETST